MLSIIIPSRNEPYLNKTINDLLKKATGEIEIIVVLDGYWEDPVVDNRVKYFHSGTPKGMRVAINTAVAVANGEYLLKTDAHCMFAEGFDKVLIADCQPNWVVIPRRYRLDAEKWELIEDGRPPIDYMGLDGDLHGVEDRGKNINSGKFPEIDDTRSFQGSCWFMHKEFYKELELLDVENYGSFWREAQEIGFKVWSVGGSIKVNKKTWYAHLHKSSRGYNLDTSDKLKAETMMKKWLEGTAWHKQTTPLLGCQTNQNPSSPYSFFTGFGGSGLIRGGQVVSRLGGKLNPTEGYENDICIYVKMKPHNDHPQTTYLDIVDGSERLDWLKRHPEVGVICQSKTALDFLKKELKNEVVLIPEHHCNFDRIRRTRTEVKVVGAIGNSSSVQIPVEELRSRLAEIGMEYLDGTYHETPEKPVTREDVIEFYKKIDVQLVWRPLETRSEKARRQNNMGNAVPLRNPLKLINAMSFGIPTVAYPEEDYISELQGYFINAHNINDLIFSIQRLSQNQQFYDSFAEQGIEKSEEYHIDNIIKLYSQLKRKENIMPEEKQDIQVSIRAKLLDKEVEINGFKVPVYGLASFGVNPKGIGLGRQTLLGFEQVAKQNGKYAVIGFCRDGIDPVGFYEKCGWYTQKLEDDHWIISSVPFQTINTQERW